MGSSRKTEVQSSKGGSRDLKGCFTDVLINPFSYGLSDQHLGMGGPRRSPRYMAVLRPNKAYLCKY